jgi:FlaA1/EpsC-like NDP-sugar epimerase
MPLPFTDRRVLLTGAGGSIGSALALAILRQKPQSIVLLDHSEGNLHQLDTELAGLDEPSSFCLQLGDVCDETLLAEIFEEKRTEIVLHAAAYKHVPLMESHVIAAIRNNALGSHLLAKMAAAYGVRAMVMVSTDKAVEPRSVMGVSKRVAELSLLRWSNAQTMMRVVRLGNVLGSHGSVVPEFSRQIAVGGPVTVTHPDAERFFFRMEETVELITSVTALDGESGIYIPEARKPMRILDLAQQMIGQAANGSHIPIRISGLRPGDKLAEAFFSGDERISEKVAGNLLRVVSPQPPPRVLDAAMESLRRCVEERDVARAPEVLCHLVPDYRPSQTALDSCKKQESSSR